MVPFDYVQPLKGLRSNTHYEWNVLRNAFFNLSSTAEGSSDVPGPSGQAVVAPALFAVVAHSQPPRPRKCWGTTLTAVEIERNLEIEYSVARIAIYK